MERSPEGQENELRYAAAGGGNGAGEPLVRSRDLGWGGQWSMQMTLAEMPSEDIEPEVLDTAPTGGIGTPT